jgi:hypothetical protein
MRMSESCCKQVDSLLMGLQEQHAENLPVQAARGAIHGGHRRDRVVVITHSAVFTNLLTSAAALACHMARLVKVASMIQVKSTVKDTVAAAAIAFMCDHGDVEIHDEGVNPVASARSASSCMSLRFDP